MAAANDSKALIETLLQAEKQAEEMIAAAKKNRLTKLRQAQTAADDELKEFRAKEEANFQSTVGAKENQDPAKDLKSTTERELQMVTADYNNNKAKTVSYVVSKVLDVPIALTSTQRQALAAGVA